MALQPGNHLAHFSGNHHRRQWPHIGVVPARQLQPEGQGGYSFPDGARDTGIGPTHDTEVVSRRLRVKASFHFLAVEDTFLATEGT